jgi:hypothetical protein
MMLLVPPRPRFIHSCRARANSWTQKPTAAGGTGVLGRVLRAFDDHALAVSGPPIKGSAYSITTDRTIFRGSPVEPILLSAAQGMLTYDGTQTATRSYDPAERQRHLHAFQELASKQVGSIFAETYNDAVRRAIVDSERISKLLANASLTQDWARAKGQASAGHGGKFVEQVC